MKALISSTLDPTYLFFIPIVEYSWKKLGVSVICFVPYEPSPLLNLVKVFSSAQFLTIVAPKNKQATYAQCARLFGGTLEYIPASEIIITSDVDMAVFSEDLLQVGDLPHVWGTDLVPSGQFAMCYVSAPRWKWGQMMRVDKLTYQEYLDNILGTEEMENMRGNLWSRDQEILYSKVTPHLYLPHPRAYPGTQFASRRVDRDDGHWFTRIGPELLDAHLWRPGYSDENFPKIQELFRRMYPEDDLKWMQDYRDKFIQLL